MRLNYRFLILFFVLKTTLSVEAHPSTQPFQYLETFDTTLSPKAILKGNWQVYTKNYIQFNYKNGYFWLKIDLNAAADSTQEWYWWFNSPQVQDIRFFHLDSTGRVFQSDLIGVNYPFNSRDVVHRLPIFSVRQRQQPTILLARFHNDLGSGNGDFGLLKVQKFVEKDYRETIIWVGVFSILGFACLFSMGLFSVYQERVYLFYGCYLLCLLVSFLGITGFAYQYFWPNFPRFAFYSKVIWLLSSILFFLQFVTHLLFLPNDRKPVLMTFLLRFSTIFYATFIIISFLGLPLNISRVLVKVYNYYLFVVIFLVMWQIVHAIRLKSSTAIYFLVAFTPTLLIPALLVAQNLSWIEFAWIPSQFLPPIGMSLEAVLLFVALLKRFQNIQKTQKLAQDNERRAYERLQEERQRISRDLHDNVGAQLSQIVAGLDAISDPNAHREHVVDLHETAKTTITQLRETIWALHQETVSVENFADKFKAYARSQVRLHPSVNLVFSEDFANPDTTLSPLQALNFYRIGQEALNNTLKYAQASRICVHFRQNTVGVFSVEIGDNGKGFDPQEAAQKESFGLTNMRFRASEIGATLDIETQSAVGTKILLALIIN